MRRRRKGLSFIEKERKIDKKKILALLDWLLWAMISVFIAWVVVFCFMQRVVVVGEAMSPTVKSGEDVFYNRFVYIVTQPKKDDVIAFYMNGNRNSHLYIRRVIAVKGDTVKAINGYIYINGVMYDGVVKLDKMNDPGLLENGVTLSENEYFVICDNINSAEDSRSGNVGNIAKDDIVGKVWLEIDLENKTGRLIH